MIQRTTTEYNNTIANSAGVQALIKEVARRVSGLWRFQRVLWLMGLRVRGGELCSAGLVQLDSCSAAAVSLLRVPPTPRIPEKRASPGARKDAPASPQIPSQLAATCGGLNVRAC